MNYIVIFIVVIVAILFLCNFQSESEQYTADIGGKPVYMYNDYHKYLYDYDLGFGNWPLWYNRVTPLPFNNPTKVYNYPYYPLIQDYYYPRLRFY
jgi:hypothetical protein